MSASEAISPTAHYTGYVWARNGLSHPELQTIEGRVLFESLRPLMIAGSVLGHPTLEAYLLARHRAIDEGSSVLSQGHYRTGRLGAYANASLSGRRSRP